MTTTTTTTTTTRKSRARTRTTSTTSFCFQRFGISGTVARLWDRRGTVLLLLLLLLLLLFSRILLNVILQVPLFAPAPMRPTSRDLITMHSLGRKSSSSSVVVVGRRRRSSSSSSVVGRRRRRRRRRRASSPINFSPADRPKNGWYFKAPFGGEKVA